MARSAAPLGHPTRGTTGTNRLRRVDRWIASRPEFTTADRPDVVDLGFGASAVTTLELFARLHRVRADVTVTGIEIDQERVDQAKAQLAQVRAGTTAFPVDAAVTFMRGGFEVAVPNPPRVIRAFNVLRQYDESAVREAWQRMSGALQPGGLLIDGTCDEIGRVASWIDIDHTATPQRLTISLRLTELIRPSIVAERLPKALIHHNVPGERVHAFLAALDTAWAQAAPLATFGPVQRWGAAVRALGKGWPVRTSPSRAKLGELTVPWEAVAP